jgi:hypothetical protein
MPGHRRNLGGSTLMVCWCGKLFYAADLLDFFNFYLHLSSEAEHHVMLFDLLNLV